jgi:hypothetical protein
LQFASHEELVKATEYYLYCRAISHKKIMLNKYADTPCFAMLESQCVLHGEQILMCYESLLNYLMPE